MMEQETKRQRAALQWLPVESKQAIMSALPDVESLKSLALTCSSLFYAFIDAEILITNRVIQNEIEDDVLPEAAAALDSSDLSPWTRQRVHAFVSQHLQARLYPPRSWTLSQALRISSLHKHIQYFATDFASKALLTMSKSSYFKSDQIPPSHTEISRIKRTLYRFEIYCNLFRDPGRTLFEVDEQRDVFFANFATWENEQLACVHDYLFRVAYPAFNDIAQHDIAWGHRSVDYEDRINLEYIQHLFSLGLAYLHQIVLAKTHKARYELLYSDRPIYTFQFLYAGLEAANDPDDGVPLSDYTEKQKLVQLRPPFFRDLDPGPMHAWLWAHQEETCESFVNTGSRRLLRDWGYVMWDRDRLDKSWDIMLSPWQTFEIPYMSDKGPSFSERLSSWQQRSKIYRAGGRGWWSHDDESQIVWLHGKPQSERPTLPTGEFASLSEARSFLATLTLPPQVTRFTR